VALPQNVKIPKSSQFGKFQVGVNRFRVLSDVITGWEGWKDKKPFRHEGDVCKIKPEQVDLNQNGRPNINYFWATVVWSYNDKAIQVLEITQKTIMTPLFDYEQSEDWGDLKGYDIEIDKKIEGDKTSYVVRAIPPKKVSQDIINAYAETKVDLQELFKGGYPMEIPPEDVPFD
jgi:hypothetical protein